MARTYSYKTNIAGNKPIHNHLWHYLLVERSSHSVTESNSTIYMWSSPGDSVSPNCRDVTTLISIAKWLKHTIFFQLIRMTHLAAHPKISPDDDMYVADKWRKTSKWGIQRLSSGHLEDLRASRQDGCDGSQRGYPSATNHHGLYLQASYKGVPTSNLGYRWVNFTDPWKGCIIINWWFLFLIRFLFFLVLSS